MRRYWDGATTEVVRGWAPFANDLRERHAGVAVRRGGGVATKENLLCCTVSIYKNFTGHGTIIAVGEES